METPAVVTFTEDGIKALKAAGIHHPDSVPSLDWLYRHRNSNGFSAAFAVVGGRKVFKPRVYLKLIEAQAAG